MRSEPPRPGGIALRVVVALGVLLSPLGGVPHLARRFGDLATATPLTGWGWVQLLFHGGVPLLLLVDAGRAIRARRSAGDASPRIPPDIDPDPPA